MLRLDATTWSPMSTPALLEKGSPSSGAAAGSGSGSSSDRRYAGESVVLEELRVEGGGGGPEKKVCPWSLPDRTFIASNFINTTRSFE